MKSFAISFLVAIMFGLMPGTMAHAGGKGYIKALVERAKNAPDGERNAINAEWVKFRPTDEDVTEILEVWKMKKWDEDLFIQASDAVKKIDKTELAERLIPMLQDDKKRITKICQLEGTGKGNRETFCRYTFVWFVLQQFEVLKVRKAIPILHEYQKIKELEYYASHTLAAMGEKGSDTAPAK